MINLRYHIISIVAVFLALGIGVLMGSTIVDRALVDNLNGQLDELQGNLEDAQSANGDLETAIGDLRRLQDSLAAEGAEQLFRHRLAGTKVLVLAVDGVDEAPVDELRRSLVGAGADVPSVVWLTDKLRLERGADASTLARILGEPDAEPAALRQVLAARLARLLRAAGVGAPVEVAPPVEGDGAATTAPPVDQAAEVPTTPPVVPTTTTVPITTVPTAVPTTTVPITTVPTADEPAGAVAVARDEAMTELLGLLGTLREADFVRQEGGPTLPDLLTARLVVVSGAGASVPDRDLASRLVVALAGEGLAPAVAVEGLPADGPGGEGRGAFVGSIRADELLRQRISTVDDLETFAGRAATVLALADLHLGRVGQYGLGEGAERLLPTPGP